MSFITVAIGMGVGAASGGIMSAINHQPIWKGMLIGAGTGAAGGALGAGLGALGGTAASTTTSAATGATTGSVGGGTAGGAVGGGTTGGVVGGVATPVASTAAPVVSTTAPTAVSTAAPVVAPTTTSSVASAAPVAAPTAAPAAQTGVLDTLKEMGWSGAGKEFAKMAAPEILKGGAGMGMSPSYDDSGAQRIKSLQQSGSESAQGTYGPGWSTSSWMQSKAKGGQIHLRNGDFIIPADVVSAIGNGSTKAGAKYLDHLFNALAAGPAPKAGSLAKRRALERHKA